MWHFSSKSVIFEGFLSLLEGFLTLLEDFLTLLEEFSKSDVFIYVDPKKIIMDQEFRWIND